MWKDKTVLWANSQNFPQDEKVGVFCCPILLQEKGARLQSIRAPLTTARNADCVKGFRTFKKWVAKGTKKMHFDCKLKKPRCLAI